MHRKLITACVVFVAFAAFVVAPAASATALTENGKTLAVGASITGTATEFKYTAGNSTVTCSHMHMSGTLTANSGGTVAIEALAGNFSATGTATGGDCTSTGLGPVKWTMSSKLCLHVNKSDVGTITGCGGPVTTKLDVTNLGITCAYSTTSMTVQITTEPKDAEVTIWEQPKFREVGQSIFCPVEMKLDVEFVLTTTDGTTLGFEQ